MTPTQRAADALFHNTLDTAFVLNLAGELEETQDRVVKNVEELVRLREEHRQVLECAVRDEPEATDGINGWAVRIQKERDSLRLELASTQKMLRVAEKEKNHAIDIITKNYKP